MPDHYKVISLGAGVQSSTLLFMADKGLLGERPDFAVFADTKDEPREVYEWYKYLQANSTIPIVMSTGGTGKGLMADYLESIETGNRASSIPFFTRDENNTDGRVKGQLWRQCTYNYKIQVVWKEIRNQLGYKPRQRFKDTVDMLIGISTDEYMRAKPSNKPYVTHAHPLLDLDMSRADCLAWMKTNGYPQPPKSSCYYCPYHSDAAWIRMKNEQPEEFERACVIDEKIRNNPKLKSKSYLHASRVPLREVEFKVKDGQFDDTDHFNNECVGMCGI